MFLEKGSGTRFGQNFSFKIGRLWLEFPPRRQGEGRGTQRDTKTLPSTGLMFVAGGRNIKRCSGDEKGSTEAAGYSWGAGGESCFRRGLFRLTPHGKLLILAKRDKRVGKRTRKGA